MPDSFIPAPHESDVAGAIRLGPKVCSGSAPDRSPARRASPRDGPAASARVVTFDNQFLAIVVVAAIAALTVSLLPRRIAPSVVVVEVLLGIVMGPHVLGIARVTNVIGFFSKLGLGMLFFFAGYELDFDRARGRPLSLATLGWGLSIVLAYGLAGGLALAGVVVSLVYTGSALATTAFGTLVPILGDAGELETPFGTYVLASGAIGELGPILLITLVLTSQDRLRQAELLVAFIALSVVLALFSVRYVWRGWPVFERTLESSSQVAVRVAVVLIFGLAVLADHLGFDVLLGGFVAGMIIRGALRGQELEVFESKLTAVGFGFLIPFFFVASGMSFDLSALGSGAALGKLGLFVILFLVVRGAPALALYRKELALLDRLALGFLSATALPLVVAITALATADGRMRTSTAAALVGAAMVSTSVFPLVGLALRRRAAGVSAETPAGGEAAASEA